MSDTMILGIVLIAIFLAAAAWAVRSELGR